MSWKKNIRSEPSSANVINYLVRQSFDDRWTRKYGAVHFDDQNLDNSGYIKIYIFSGLTKMFIIIMFSYVWLCGPMDKDKRTHSFLNTRLEYTHKKWIALVLQISLPNYNIFFQSHVTSNWRFMCVFLFVKFKTTTIILISRLRQIIPRCQYISLSKTYKYNVKTNSRH